MKSSPRSRSKPRTSRRKHPLDMVAAARRELDAITLEMVEKLSKAYAGENRFLPILKSVLPRIAHLSESAGLGVYVIKEDCSRLIAQWSYPEKFRSAFAEERLDESHLRDVIKSGKERLYRRGGRQLSLETFNGHIKSVHLPLALVPLAAHDRIIGVVEFVGCATVNNKKYFRVLSRMLSGSLSVFLQYDRPDDEDRRKWSNYLQLLENVQDGVSVVVNQKFAYVNSAMARLFGYDLQSDLLGRSIGLVIAKEDRARVLERSRARADQREVPQRYEYKGQKRTGEIIDIEVSVARIKYDERIASLSVHRDVTRRKRLEHELQESEQMYRNIIEGVLTVGDALVVTDLKGKVLQVNDEFERLTGRKKTEAIGEEFPYPWIPDEEMARYLLWISELRSKRNLRDFDMQWRNVAKKIIPVSMNTTLLYNAVGNPVAMMNMARDITARKQLEEENRLQLERLRVLYELGRILTSTLNQLEICEAVHQHLLQVIPFDSFFIDLFDEAHNTITSILSYDIVEGQHTRVPGVSHESALNADSNSAKVISQRKSVLELRSPGDHGTQLLAAFGDKSRRSLSLIFVPMFSKERIIGILSIQSYVPYVYSDANVRLLESFANLAAIALEKAELYEETIAKSIQIETRNKELDDFTYVVSHDLKEPLITVEGYGRILAQEHAAKLSDEAQGYMHSIVQSCTRMKELIDDLLILSRVVRLSEVVEEVSFREIINEVLDDLKFSLQEKKISVRMPEVFPTYRCNATQLRLVFRNLLSNAVKFNNNPNPHITLSITEDKDKIVCSVADNGIGIDKRFFDKIFVIFQRLHRTDEYEGSGAGLAIVKKIIEQYQGQIWVESEIGKGATFYFSLPK